MSTEIFEQMRRDDEARVLAETQRLETDGAPPLDAPPVGEEAAFPAAYFAPARGLTKREYFAACALQGLLATGNSYHLASYEAVFAADALLEELKR